MGRSVDKGSLYNQADQTFGPDSGPIDQAKLDQLNAKQPGNLKYQMSDFDEYNQTAARKQQEAAEQDQRDQQAKLVAQQKSDMINQHDETSREDYNQTLKDNKTAANSRGLLYSGIKQGADYSAAGSQAADSASYANKVNTSADSDLNTIQQQSAQAGLQSYQTGIKNAQTDYQDALERKKSNPIGQIGQAVGTVAGSLLPF